MRFKLHLLRFALATTFPLLALAVALAVINATTERRAIQESTYENARALQLAIDRELLILVATLEALGTSPTVDTALASPGSAAAQRPFLAQVAALLSRSPTALQSIVLFDDKEQQIANSQRPAGTALPKIADAQLPPGLREIDRAAESEAVLRTKRPSFTPLYVGAVSRRYVAGVFVPVVRGGRVVGALNGNFTPKSLGDVLRHERLRPGWIATLVDQRGVIVARSHDEARFVGRPVSGQPEESSGAYSGWTRSLEGEAVYGSAVPLSVAPWTISYLAPEEAFVTLYRRSLVPLAIGGIALTAAAAAAAFVIGRRLGKEIEGLAAAGSIASIPEKPEATPTHIAEVRAARHALVAAANDARQRVAEREREAAHQRLLAAELSHRVKNALAVVQSIAHQTLRRSRSLDEFRRAFEGRLAAFSVAHDMLLRSNWTGLDLKDLAESELAPFRDERGCCIAIGGPPVTLDAKRGVALALILHELTTNAAKYGAFNASGATLTLRWTIEPDEAGKQLHLTWREDGIPAPSLEVAGFGTKLIERSTALELGGEAKVSVDRTCLTWDLRFPLETAKATAMERGAG